MVLALSIIGLAVAIVAGNLSKINIGVIAMSIAFFLGVLGLGMSVSDIINFWPIRIMFFLIAIALLFGHAIETGTLDLLSKKMLYAVGGNAKILPFAAFLLTGIVDILGAGGSTPGIMAPIVVPMMVNAGLSPIIGAVAICMGAFAFGQNPVNGFGGVVGVGLLEDLGGYGHEAAFGSTMYQWASVIIMSIICLVISYFVLGCHKAKRVEQIEKPEAFNGPQKTALAIMVIALALMFLPVMFSMFFPGIAWLKTLADLCQPQSVMIVAALICLAIRLCDQKKVFAHIPVNTIVQICGVCILVGIATEAGLGDAIAAFVGQEGFPVWLIAPLLAAFCGFLTLFSSMTSVVFPIAYAVVPAVAAATGLNPVGPLCAVWCGCSTAGMSPFSLAGALIIGSIPDAELAERMVTKQLVFSIGGIILGALISATGVWNIFPNVLG